VFWKSRWPLRQELNLQQAVTPLIALALPSAGKEFIMKFHVNSSCIGCGLCASACPEVFHLTDENVAEAVSEDVSPDLEAGALEAKANCPVSAIESSNQN
jgi:ferredoxin